VGTCILLSMVTLSCASSKEVLYVSLRPSPTAKTGLLRLAVPSVKCTSETGEVFMLENAGGYYLLHESDLDTLIRMAKGEYK